MKHKNKTAIIMIIDDNINNLKLLTSMLKKRGYLIRPFNNGQIALKSIKLTIPELILLDIIMPEIDGFEICRQLKADKQTCNIPIIFISALYNTDDKLKAFSLGGADYITKPFDEKEVLARVKTHLTIQNLHREIKHERDLFHCLAETAFEGIIIHEQGKIKEVNRAAEVITGFAKNELKSMNILEIFTSKYHDIIEEYDKNSRENIIYEVQGKHKKGHTVLLEIQGKQIKYLDKNLQMTAIRDISLRKGLEYENRTLSSSLNFCHSFGKLVGRNSEMIEIFKKISKAGASDSPVLISGETGTGKELVALTIFNMSRSYKKAFVKVNCAAILEPLFESLFFGYTQGAFTGAEKDKPGYFEQAQGGTLFLDEVSELTPIMQAKLLRVLQDGDYMPVGSTQSRTADVRIISATNMDIEKMLYEGDMREDFFHRLHVLPIKIPPLRFRKDDIPLLIEHFIADQPSSGIQPFNIPEKITAKLYDYDWPGNVRELFNVLKRYFSMGDIELSDYRKEPLENKYDLPFLENNLRLNKAVKFFEKYYIKRTIEQNRGQKKQAAQALGITRKTLYNKLK